MRYSCASLANPLGGIHRLMAGPSTMPTTLKMATSAVIGYRLSPKAALGLANVCCYRWPLLATCSCRRTVPPLAGDGVEVPAQSGRAGPRWWAQSPAKRSR